MTDAEKYNKKFRLILIVAVLVATALYILFNMADYNKRVHNIEFHSEIRDTTGNV